MKRLPVWLFLVSRRIIWTFEVLPLLIHPIQNYSAVLGSLPPNKSNNVSISSLSKLHRRNFKYFYWTFIFSSIRCVGILKNNRVHGVTQMKNNKKRDPRRKKAANWIRRTHPEGELRLPVTRRPWKERQIN